MSAQESVYFLSPVGRLVMGDCFKSNDKDSEGNPLLYKHGTNAGKPRVEWFIGIAIDKKDPGWNAFYTLAYTKARQEFPTLFDAQGRCISPKFAFKIIDGDSQVPNGKGNKPCDREGFAGHWIVCMSDGYAPKCYGKGGEPLLTEPSSIQRGYYVRVHGSVRGNESMQQPGIFFNVKMVELYGYGQVIESGPDAKSAFGAAPAAYVPAGMTAAPVAGAAKPAMQPPAQTPVQQAAPMQPPAQTPVQQAAPMQPPPVAAAPAVPDYSVLATPAPAGPTMTEKAKGIPLQAFLDRGWTLDALKANGYIA